MLQLGCLLIVFEVDKQWLMSKLSNFRECIAAYSKIGSKCKAVHVRYAFKNAVFKIVVTLSWCMLIYKMNRMGCCWIRAMYVCMHRSGLCNGRGVISKGASSDRLMSHKTGNEEFCTMLSCFFELSYSSLFLFVPSSFRCFKMHLDVPINALRPKQNSEHFPWWISKFRNEIIKNVANDGRC